MVKRNYNLAKLKYNFYYFSFPFILKISQTYHSFVHSHFLFPHNSYIKLSFFSHISPLSQAYYTNRNRQRSASPFFLKIFMQPFDFSLQRTQLISFFLKFFMQPFFPATRLILVRLQVSIFLKSSSHVVSIVSQGLGVLSLRSPSCPQLW